MMLSVQGLGTQLRHLIELLDGGLDELYQRDHEGYRPRYTPIMRALEDVEHLTIKAIAQTAGISHSAASQTVAKMISEDLLEQSAGRDARERLIRLSDRGRSLLPTLKERWIATQKAADELDRELSVPLSQIAAEAIDALTNRSFTTRILEHERTDLEQTR